jgi:glycerophosphoryl diester phosphodiesterase
MRHPYFDVPRPIAIGHRGACGERPENTLVSFARALEVGARILETDVQLTRDGEVVVLHDDDVTRTTDGAGRARELTLAELQRLDAGFRFSPDGGRSYPARGRGVRIPTLAEAFAAFPGARFNVELKANEPLLAARTVALVREWKREALTLLAAAEDDTMATLRAELASTGARPAMGASTGDVLGFIRAALSGGAPPPEPMALQIPTTFAGEPLVTPQLVAFAHRHDVQVHVWTVNDPVEMRQLLALGVDGLVSDYPARVVEAARERAS